MKLQVVRGDLTKTKADLLVVNLFEGETTPGGATGAVDKALRGVLSHYIKDENFKAKEGEIFALYTHGHIPAKKVAVVGLGKREDFSLETVRRVTGAAVQYAQKTGAKTIASILHGAGIGGLVAKESAQAMAEGALLASYNFEKYKTKDSEQKTDNIEQFIIVERNLEKVRDAREGVLIGEIYAHGTSYARDLVNEPPGAMTPSQLVNAAKELAIRTHDYLIEIEAFDKNRLAAMGAGGILGIAKGSDEEPFLIHLTYKPNWKLKTENWKLPRVALVGKGVTFDSGGLSLKPSDHMDDMKLDMAGSAAILGVFSVLGRLKPQLEIHGVIAAVENLPSGRALKPGDVVKTLSGKTVEVLNTDAEGRVILADALEYASRLNPTAIVDLATLTGACMVALGDRVAGLMGNDEQLIEKLRAAADSAGERIWPLPMPADYKEELKSEVADLSNVHQTRFGGAILGGMFLQEFVKKETPWAHLDLAGPVFAKKPFSSYQPKGATGFGVRTLLNYLTSNNP